MAATITIRSNEFLNTLEKGYTSDPIDMPESEENEEKEYIVQRDAFLNAYQHWDRSANPILELYDELSREPIWLGQDQADAVNEAVQHGKDTVELY